MFEAGMGGDVMGKGYGDILGVVTFFFCSFYQIADLVGAVGQVEARWDTNMNLFVP
jgi:hypothetical protein